MDRPAVLTLLLSAFPVLRPFVQSSHPNWDTVSFVNAFLCFPAECRSVSIVAIRKKELDWLTDQLNLAFVADFSGLISDLPLPHAAQRITFMVRTSLEDPWVCVRGCVGVRVCFAELVWVCGCVERRWWRLCGRGECWGSVVVCRGRTKGVWG